MITPFTPYLKKSTSTPQQKLMKIRIAMLAVAVLLFALVFFVLKARGGAQQAGQAQPPTPAVAQQATPELPGAKDADVKSIDAIIAATYDVISGPAGDRDWNRFRSLFIPEARLIPVRKPANGTPSLAVMTVDDYVNRAGGSFKQNGFFESELSRKQEQYGHIAHVFSTYESRHAKGEKPFARGINSFSLFNDGKRWYVVQIYWDAEAPGQEIPDKYLH